MKKHLILLFVVLLLASQSFLVQAQQRVLPNWKVGDEITVQEIGKAKITIFGIEVPLDVSTEYTIKVKSKASDGYLIEVGNMNFLNISGGGIMSPIIKELSVAMEETMKKAKEMKLLVKVSTVGEVKDLENWQEVQAMLTQLLKEMTVYMSEKYSMPKEKSDSLVTVQLQKIDTKEKVMQETLESIEELLSGYNVPFYPKGTLESPALMFSKMNYFELNHTGIPATLKSKLISKTTSKTKLYFDILYDKEALKKHIKEHSNDFTKADEKMLDNMIVKENRTFEYDAVSSWPTKINSFASLKMEDMLYFEITSEVTLTKK